jgi:hypothetical protein
MNFAYFLRPVEETKINQVTRIYFLSNFPGKKEKENNHFLE